MTNKLNCDTCRCNKVCDHNKFGFENCGNYIPAGITAFEELVLLQQENVRLRIERDKLKQILFRASPDWERFCTEVAVITVRIDTVERFSKHLKESAVGVINLSERYFCIKEKDIDDFVERVRNNE